MNAFDSIDVSGTIASIADMSEPALDRLRSNMSKWLTSRNPARREAARQVEKAIGEMTGTQAPVVLDELSTDDCVDRLRRAFQCHPATEAEAQAIGVLLRHPDRTSAELAARLGWDGPAWRAQFREACRAREDMLWRPQYTEQPDAPLYSSILAEYFPDTSTWRIRAELAATLAELVNVEPAEMARA